MDNLNESPVTVAAATSAADGSFTLSVPRAGRWELRLEADGFVTAIEVLEIGGVAGAFGGRGTGPFLS